MGADSGISPPTVWDRVVDVLLSDSFRGHAGGFDRRRLIHRVNSLGGHPMRLLHWGRLKELGRIPHSDEGEAIDAITGIEKDGATVVEVFMVSHRWLRPSLDRRHSHPDSHDNRKAVALDEFSEWRRQWVLSRHGFLPELYYWIDYSCIDQTRADEALPLLPLWVACCERFLRIETADYDDRMWCRLEPLLSYVFSFADHHVSIGLDFRSRWPRTGSREKRVILDPRDGLHTDPRDTGRVAPLVELAIRLAPVSHAGSAVEPGRTSLTCYSL